MSEIHEQRVVREYGSYGEIVGGALGLVIGVVVAGPHFSDWTASTLAAVILGCACGGMVVGFIASRWGRSTTRNDDTGSATWDSTSESAWFGSDSGDSGDSGGCGGDGGGD